ncbi:MAG: hypothetical protein ABSE95_08590 [Thermodesulfobacteriota bacterium]
MKRLMILFITLWILGWVSFALADSYHGSRYNPYDPYRNEAGRDQGPAAEKSAIDTEKPANPYGTEPRRWYDSEENYQRIYEPTAKDPKTLTHPYEEVKPHPSQELTSPYEGVIPQSPDKPTTTQQLTPPTVK